MVDYEIITQKKNILEQILKHVKFDGSINFTNNAMNLQLLFRSWRLWRIQYSILE